MTRRVALNEIDMQMRARKPGGLDTEWGNGLC
jgi:hypothetical protein